MIRADYPYPDEPGMALAVFICDPCGERITVEADGIVVWAVGAASGQQISHTHCAHDGACTGAMTGILESLHPDAEVVHFSVADFAEMLSLAHEGGV